MAMSEENRQFVEGLIDYYVSESGSYVQMAEGYGEVGSVPDAAFGIIVGCVYSGFMQARGRDPPGLDEVQELGRIIGERAGQIKEAVCDPRKGDKGDEG